MKVSNTYTPPVHVLLVEDNPDDIFFTRMAFEKSRWVQELHVVEDGEEALKFLHREENYASSPRPHLVLLDLNLPRKPGLEVLEQIKLDRDLKDIPVVVLTTSTYEEDVRRSYRSHANSYINKPVGLDDFMDVVKLLETYWFSVSTLPPGDA